MAKKWLDSGIPQGSGWYPTGETREVVDYESFTTTLSYTSDSKQPTKFYVEPNDTNINDITLPEGQYEFRVQRVTDEDDEDDIYNKSEMNVRFLEEINTTDLNYGGLALLGLYLKATPQVSGQRPNFSTLATRSPLLLDGLYRPSDNPAWICYDIITNPFYGMGYSDDKIDKVAFQAWADFCDNPTNISTFNVQENTYEYLSDGSIIIPFGDVPQGEGVDITNLDVNNSTFSMTTDKGTFGIHDIVSIEQVRLEGKLLDNIRLTFTKGVSDGSITAFNVDLVFFDKSYIDAPKLKFNGIQDTLTNVWNALQDVASVGRGQVILQGNKYSVIWDAPKVATNLFNVSNANNFSVSYTNLTDIATEIEVQYSDKELDYAMNQIVVQDTEAQLTNTRGKKTTIQVLGITSQEEAIRHGEYLLATSKNLRRKITFDANVNAIADTVGDLVYVQMDVVNYGSGGTIQAKNGNTVTLQEPVSTVNGTNYTLKVIDKTTDDITDYTYTGINTGTFDLVLNDASNINVGDRYSFGESGSEAIPCIITEIDRDGDLTRQVTCIEYNESILDFDYTNDAIQRIVPTRTDVSNVNNLQIDDRLVKQSSGQVVPILRFTWDDVKSNKYNVFMYPPINVPEGSLAKIVPYKKYLGRDITTRIFEYNASDLAENKEYTFYVETSEGVRSVTATDFTITAFSKVPDQITGVTSNSSNGDLILNWGANTELDFKRYVVKVGTLNELYTDNTTITIPNLNVGSYSVEVYAEDTSGNRSTVTTHTAQVTEPSIKNQVEDSYLIEKAFRDGLMTIFVGLSADKSSASNYDIWKIPMSSLTLDEFTYASTQLEGLSFNDFNDTTFKYYLNGTWYLCTKAQLLVVQRMLGYAIKTALLDGALRIFMKQPYPPYDLGDVWVDGDTVKYCKVAKEE